MAAASMFPWLLLIVGGGESMRNLHLAPRRCNSRPILLPSAQQRAPPSSSSVEEVRRHPSASPKPLLTPLLLLLTRRAKVKQTFLVTGSEKGIGSSNNHLSTPRRRRRTYLEAIIGTTTLALGAGLMSNTAGRAGAEIAPDKDKIDALSNEAVEAFQKGDYEKVMRNCKMLVEQRPAMVFAWSLLGTAELILGSKDLTMNGGLNEQQEALLRDAIKHFDTSTSLAGDNKDALTLNNKANALGLLEEWEQAVDVYEEAFQITLDTRMKDFEVIPMMNKALGLFELNRDQAAEEQLQRTIRRNPDYPDAYAALATVLWGQGMKFKAADSFDKLCDLDYGLCDAYSDIRVVLGRWPKRAIRTYRDFLEAYRDERKQVVLK